MVTENRTGDRFQSSVGHTNRGLHFEGDLEEEERILGSVRSCQTQEYWCITWLKFALFQKLRRSSHRSFDRRTSVAATSFDHLGRRASLSCKPLEKTKDLGFLCTKHPLATVHRRRRSITAVAALSSSVRTKEEDRRTAASPVAGSLILVAEPEQKNEEEKGIWARLVQVRVRFGSAQT